MSRYTRELKQNQFMFYIKLSVLDNVREDDSDTFDGARLLLTVIISRNSQLDVFRLIKIRGFK